MEAICGQFTQIQGFNCFPISNLGSAWGAICSRGDLDPKNAMPDGCYDAKISDLTMARERRALAVNGPTPGTGLGVFKWNDAFKDTFHWGTPDVYNFSFVEMKPIL